MADSPCGVFQHCLFRRAVGLKMHTDTGFECVNVIIVSRQCKCGACAQASFEHSPPRNVSPSLECPRQQVISDFFRNLLTAAVARAHRGFAQRLGQLEGLRECDRVLVVGNLGQGRYQPTRVLP